MKERIEQLAERLGIECIPESWRVNWPDYEEWVSGGKCGDLRWALPPNAAEVFDLPVESLPDLEGMYDAIRASDELRELADFWHYMIYHFPDGMERNTNVWAIPDRLLGHPTKLFALAVMVSGADHAVENFGRTGVSDQVIRDSLGYIGRYARDIKQRRGVWGLESVGWLSNYVRANIFRLGRLTFKAGRYNFPFRAFRNRQSGEVMVLCEPSVKYRTDCLSDGTHGIFDPQAWTPTLEIGPHTITGHPAVDGVAIREPVVLKTQEWEQVLAPGDPSIEVHIAGGSKLDAEECIDAYRQAVDFFPAYYPETGFAVFTCWSWLLDPALPKILPPESNIVKFQRPFHILPVPANEAQAYDLVFGDPNADLTKITPTTNLQRVIVDYVSAGNRLRSAAGIIIWDEAMNLIR